MTTPVKATLTVILKANDVVVAEVEDATLWQRVLTVIHGGKLDLAVEPSARGSGESGSLPSTNVGRAGSTNPVDLLAQQLGVDRAFVEGACSPSAEAPHMHLDLHCWEEMKRQLPSRGPTSLSPILASATLLALWFHKAGLGNPTQAQAKAVLATINITDPNASRSIQNATWLQSRAGGQVLLNPAEISKAVKLARCFCSKDWSLWKETASA